MPNPIEELRQVVDDLVLRLADLEELLDGYEQTWPAIDTEEADS
jgi:hypothetical protein